MAYGWSIAVGAFYALLTTLGGLWLFFVATFPWENMENPGSDDWLIVVAFVMLCASGLMLFGVIARFPSLAIASFVVGAAAGAVALHYAVSEWSSHGDEELLALGAAVCATGLITMALSIRAARARRLGSPARL